MRDDQVPQPSLDGGARDVVAEAEIANHSFGILPDPVFAADGRFVSIDANERRTCAINARGAATCWTTDGDLLQDTPHDRFAAVAVGRAHFCGLRADGMLVCRGEGGYGQATVPSGRFEGVSSGTRQSCGLLEDNSISCWGRHRTVISRKSPCTGPALDLHWTCTGPALDLHWIWSVRGRARSRRLARR